jgi:hypothetical protein
MKAIAIGEFPRIDDGSVNLSHEFGVPFLFLSTEHPKIAGTRSCFIRFLSGALWWGGGFHI